MKCSTISTHWLTKRPISILFIFIILFNTKAISQELDYPITPIPFNKVKISDDFWAPKILTNHKVTIPIAFDQSEKTGRVDNFKIAGDLMEGQFCTIYPFDDSDVYKMIEAASFSLMTFPDPALESRIDSLVEIMAAAQEEDGYLYTNRTIGKNIHPWAGDNRWDLVHELSHELYNMGHLFEAATAHFQATGKNNLLDIAVKAADLICQEFGYDGIKNVPGHQEVEIGLVKLYRLTKDEKYLKTAKFFLDIRGQESVGNPKKYDQSHIPVIEQSEAVGHAVRGAYMWAAMADIAAITGDAAYINAIDLIWHDIVDGKYYINGGIGATSSGEAFGESYELPNMTAYCETCAGVGNAIWNHRMFLMKGESKYIDVLERTMYNNILDGISLSGDRFFYPNPLASAGQHERKEWFGCACCPPNVARFLPSMPGYIYAVKENDIYINLYISSATTIVFQDQLLAIQQISDFPWEGNAAINVEVEEPVQANFRLRIPGYVINRPVPSDLYFYDNHVTSTFEVKVNGELIASEMDEAGYVSIDRIWSKNDKIEVSFPFELKKVVSHPKVMDNKGKVAFERGPLLYCAEWADQQDGKVLNKFVEEDQVFKLQQSPNLGGIYQFTGSARNVSRTLGGNLEVGIPEPLTLVPYHLWNNRGPGEMSVWIGTNPESVLPEPAPTIARRSKLTASVDSRAISAINDQILPSHSNDHSVSYLHWWPNKATEEWVQLDFDQEEEISGLEIYWFDDGPHGGCRIPEQWQVEYLNGDDWKPVVVQGEYPIIKDALNRIEFESVSASAVRVVITLPKEYASGIYEIVLNGN